MKKTFGDGTGTAKALKTENEMSAAIETLFWWRMQYGLEHALAIDPMFFPESQYEMCSKNTKNLAAIYIQYMMSNCCDARPKNYYPLLDRLNSWMDESKGGTLSISTSPKPVSEPKPCIFPELPIPVPIEIIDPFPIYPKPPIVVPVIDPIPIPSDSPSSTPSF